MSIYGSGRVGDEGGGMKKIAGLNLLPSSAKFQAIKVRWKSRIKKISIVMGVVYCLLGLVLVVWLVVVTKINQGVKLTLASFEARLVPLAAKVNTSQQIKYQAKIVAKVLEGRFEYSKYLLLMRQIMPPEVVVEKSELMEKSGIKIEGVAKDKVGMNALEKRILEINKGKLPDFSSAKLKSLNYVDGNYRFSLEVMIKNEKK